MTVGSNNSVTLFIQQLLFEGVRGASFAGDIAIDDFKLMDGACNQPAYCDFEKDDWCTWTNSDKEDVFDWLLGSGSTPSVYTGPSNDHTTGVLRLLTKTYACVQFVFTIREVSGNGGVSTISFWTANMLLFIIPTSC